MQTYEEVEGSHKREWSRGVAGGGERGEGCGERGRSTGKGVRVWDVGKGWKECWDGLDV